MTREKSAPKKIIHGKWWKIGPIIMITPHLCASPPTKMLSRIKTQVTTTKSKKGKQQSSSLKVKGVAIEVERVGGNV